MSRIDIELVNRGLFSTRSKAQFAIKSGVVYCNDKKVIKNGFDVKDEDKLEVKSLVLPYVSKGGLKLEKALKEFNINLSRKNMIDIGSSTGGFSDCALQNGINHILAIDVGSNQFSLELLNSNKIELMENTDFRDVSLDKFKGYDFASIDVSFISIKKLIPKLGLIEDLDEIVLLVKPQFECGKDLAKEYNGVVLNKKVHKEILEDIVKSFNSINFYLEGLTYSPIRGGSGNIEYLAYFTKNGKNNNIDKNNIVNLAFSDLTW